MSARNGRMAADVETLIVGGGISGICIAVHLLKSGRQSFAVVEKSGELGGTWSMNKYPGCACDVPSPLYSFSFAPNPSWTKLYADRQEIHDYLKACALRHGVLPHFRFHTLALAASWDASSALWRIRLQDVSSSEAYSISARFLVRAIGAFNVPKFPSIKGMEQFAGASFHSSAWDGSFDLHGKTVAIIGTGASAIQIAPNVATIAEKLYVCQRTPVWILPKLDCLISKRWRSFFKQAPFLKGLFSWLLFLLHELLVLAFLDWKAVRRFLERAAQKHMERSIKDAETRDLLLPKYEMGCKRLLLSNTFYPILARPNVELKAYPILEIHEHGIIFGTNSSELTDSVNVDAIIYATGFDAFFPALEVTGSSGLKYTEAGFSSLLGTTKHGFPNFFMLLGPNSGLGHTSVILIIEAQARYIISCMSLMTPMVRSMEPRSSSQQNYQAFLARKFSKTVWRPGSCNSWYLDSKEGKNYALWQASSIEYIYRSRCADPMDYLFE